jgi:hypothetical protein
MADGRFVSWDRWDATNAETNRRLARLETIAERRAGIEQEFAGLEERVVQLEDQRSESERVARGRRDRLWVITLTVISGVVFPIVVTSVIAFLHLRS